MKRLLYILMCIVALPQMLRSASDTPHQAVGLVLSGGGAKGIAHIGVIQALEDHDIPIDFVTGTSMGAIVGGLYAAGYTPAEMMDLITSREFSYWSTGRIDPTLTYFFGREPQSPAMFSASIPYPQQETDSVPASLISGQPMSFAFMDLFSAYTAQCGGDFDRLFVPFRCVASDVAAHRKHVFSSGNLGEAIRASMTFPIVFQPITIDGTYYYDGGIYDNFPVDVMRHDFSPSVMIGVDVSASSKSAGTSLMDQLESLVIQNHDHSLPASEGIKMHIDLDRFSLLDFPKAREIYQVGYDHAMTMIDSICERIPTRIPAMTRNLNRDVFKSKSPYVRFDSINVSGASDHQCEYIKYLFRPETGSDTIGIARARDAYYRAIGSGKLRDLFPTALYNDSTGLFTLDLKASVRPSLKGSVGGYITSSTNSFLYASVSYSTLSFSSLNTSLEAWIGQSVMAGVFNGRLYLHTPLPSAVGAQAVVSRSRFYDSDHIFFEDKSPSFIVDHEYFGRAFWSMAAGRRGEVNLGAGYGALRCSYYPSGANDFTADGRRRADFNLAQIFGQYEATTLSEPTFPTSGSSLRATAMGVAGSGEKWIQAEAVYRSYPAISNHFTLGYEADVLYSTRSLRATYSSTVATASDFAPTPAAHNAFRAPFRATSFAAAGIIPIYRHDSNLSARLGVWGFAPLRKFVEEPTGAVRYGHTFGSAELFTEADICYHFPFGTLTGYVNYATGPKTDWNVGLSFGIFILPPKFLR